MVGGGEERKVERMIEKGNGMDTLDVVRGVGNESTFQSPSGQTENDLGDKGGAVVFTIGKDQKSIKKEFKNTTNRGENKHKDKHYNKQKITKNKKQTTKK